MSELAALLNGTPVGTLSQLRTGQLLFTYSDDWRDSDHAYPISLSMPFALRVHRDRQVRPFLLGLLPDNPDTLVHWGEVHDVSPNNPFALLARMGEDCAGAIQFTQPERVEELRAGRGSIEWLAEADVADLLDEAIRFGLGRHGSSQGQFSLAGAQPKTALHFDNGRWGIPSGSTPTTHILKPPGEGGFATIEINEHFCLSLAKDLRIPAASSEVVQFAGRPAIVVERYDRTRSASGHVARIHQEDFCQALAVPPQMEYENRGGPGAADIVKLLLDYADDPDADVARFIDALVLNWVIMGTDAHAKNYSIMLRAGSIRLAPLYDLISWLPYESGDPHRTTLSMRVGDEYVARRIGRSQWADLAGRCGLDMEPLLDRVAELLRQVPAAVESVSQQLDRSGLVAGGLPELVVDRATSCLRKVDVHAR